MVQMQILTGKKAGRIFVARRFPWRIGRATGADLRLEEDGIWDSHLELSLSLPEGFTISLQPDALATVNGRSFQQIRLRNGDLLEIGAVKIRFGLSDTRLCNLRWREGLTWFFLIALLLGQVVIIYWLIR
jgi:pSer/pThr/pTyr-binding forkhead associated (FHA) protein